MKPRIGTTLAPMFGLMLSVWAGGCMDPDGPGNLVRRTVAEDASLPRLQVNGTTLHAESFGNPAHPVVLVLHGGPGGDYRALLPLQALAADGYRVVFWDQRGTGLSQRHDPGDFTWTALLEDLRQVIDSSAPGATQPLVFIGHSWGAMYATIGTSSTWAWAWRTRWSTRSGTATFRRSWDAPSSSGVSSTSSRCTPRIGGSQSASRGGRRLGRGHVHPAHGDLPASRLRGRARRVVLEHRCQPRLRRLR